MPADVPPDDDESPSVRIALPHDSDTPPDGPDAARGVTHLAATLMQLAPIALIAFSWVNFPVRYVPPRLRVAVDWLALTLVFWVPVVWLIAWMA